MGWVEIEAGSANRADHYEGEGAPLYTADPYYDPWYGWVNIEYIPYWHWASIQVAHTVMVPTNVVSGRTTEEIKVTHKIDNLTHGQYDIMVVRNTPNKDNFKIGDKMVVSAVREVTYDDFTYPRSVLVGIRALATNQLSGSFNFSTEVDGALLNVWNGASWVVTYSNNPAWVCWDVLTQPVMNDSNVIVRYDGIDPTRLDRNAFYTWAQFCDQLVNDGKGGTEKRFTFNGVFDAPMKLWEAALRIAAMSRALLVFNGTTISVIVDQAVTLPSGAVQLFSMGNIIADSFEETFLSLEDRSGEIEVSYNDPESNYERSVISVYSTLLDRPSNKTNLDLIGCTSASQAWRVAQFQLLQNEYIKRVIKFDADVDAIACQIGDVVYFSHDVPKWSIANGRIVSAASSSVTLENPVTIENGKTYNIMVRLSNDTLVTKTVTNAVGTQQKMIYSLLVKLILFLNRLEL